MKHLLALATLLLAIFTAAAPARAQDMYGYGYDWTGLYAGILGGPGVVRVKAENGSEVSNTTGILVGVNGGYLRQLGSIVFGADGEIGLTDVSNLFNGTPTGTLKVNATASIRARIGYSFDLFQVYGTGGLGFAYLSDGTLSSPEAGWLTGWTAGLGVAYAFTDGISVDLRYLHTELGPAAVGIATNRYAISADTVTVGVNFRF